MLSTKRLALISLLLAPSPLISQTFDPSSAGVEGIWFAGYKMRPSFATLKLELRLFETVGELHVETKTWQDLPYNDCTYAFERTGDGIENMLLTKDDFNRTCPDKIDFEVTRTGLNTITATFPPEIIESTEMSTNLRPITEGETYPANEKLDVLGVQTRQTRAQAEERLESLGFNIESARVSTASGDNWTADIVTYVREGEGVINDVFTVNYTPQFEGEDSPEIVAGIQRQWTIPEDQNFTPASMHDAMVKKYGETEGNRENWVYAEGSRNVRNTLTECNRDLLPIQAVRLPGRNDLTVDPDCGSRIQAQLIHFLSDNARLEGMNISVVDAETAWKTFWDIYSADETARLNAQLKLTDSAPEL